MATNAKTAIVAIHGVGTPAPGDIVKELSRLYPANYYRRDDLVAEGTTFARLVSSGDAPDLLEVNWSDIKRPPRSIMGIAEWIVSLSFALSRARQYVASDMLYLQRFHAIFLETVLLWVLFPVLLGLMHANLLGYPLAVADAAVIGFAVGTRSGYGFAPCCGFHWMPWRAERWIKRREGQRRILITEQCRHTLMTGQIG